MDSYAKQLRKIVGETTIRLEAISEAQAQSSVNGDEWSAKQVLGHLIDSASNNHARFVRVQFRDNYKMISYHQEDWVSIQQYATEPWSNLVKLWSAFNLHIAHIFAHLPASAMQNQVDASDIGVAEPLTLEFLVADYIEHLKGHLKQLFATVGGEVPPF